jgi:ankyrin repeat protein
MIVVKELLENKANINAQIPGNPQMNDPYFSDNLKTPLHLAAQLGYANMVSFLLEKGADPLIKDLSGRTPSMVIDAIRFAPSQKEEYKMCKAVLLKHENLMKK